MPKVECKVESLEIRSIHIGAYCYRISTSRLQNHLWGILVVAGIRLGVFCRPSCCCCLSGSWCWFFFVFAVPVMHTNFQLHGTTTYICRCRTSRSLPACISLPPVAADALTLCVCVSVWSECVCAYANAAMIYDLKQY